MIVVNFIYVYVKEMKIECVLLKRQKMASVRIYTILSWQQAKDPESNERSSTKALISR